MSRIFITGIAGFIGSHIAEQCLKAGHEVWGVDNLSGGDWSNIPGELDDIEPRVFDIAKDTWGLDRSFEEWHPDFVIHCAAMASENLSHNCRSFTYHNNLVGSANVVNACVKHKVKCLVTLSSIAVMGDTAPPYDESTPPNPKDPYGIAKYAHELDVKAAHEFFGLNYVILRPHNVIGVRQNMADATRNVVSIFIRQALAGEPLTIFGDGTQTRAFTPVEYVARAAIHGLIEPGEYGHHWNCTKFCGYDHPMMVLDIAKMVCDEVGIEPTLRRLPDRKETKHAFTHGNLKAFGYDQAKDIQECIKEMVAEARKAPQKPLQSLPPIELTENMPDVWRKLL